MWQGGLWRRASVVAGAGAAACMSPASQHCLAALPTRAAAALHPLTQAKIGRWSWTPRGCSPRAATATALPAARSAGGDRWGSCRGHAAGDASSPATQPSFAVAGARSPQANPPAALPPQRDGPHQDGARWPHTRAAVWVRVLLQLVRPHHSAAQRRRGRPGAHALASRAGPG